MQNKLNIALISDFFYPCKGGVETHIKTVGEELVKLGHNVIVITHSRENMKGIKIVGNLIVYYLDLILVEKSTSFPTLYANFLLFKDIYLKHRIEIAHGHQSLSNLCMEGLFHASHLKIKTVLTDHSAFEIAKYERILVNNLTSFICKNIDQGVCVSQVSKFNTHIRTGIPLNKIAVIPNGIVPEIFYPSKKLKKSKITLLYMSRLTYRKGVDLFISALPLICKNKNIEVIVVGTGPKKSNLEQTIDENDLQDQVSIQGEIKYEEVGNFLRKGDIFLNTSLTETFCLANLEAVSCGLITVSTNVGGVSEVLENGNSILFCSPTAEDITEQVENAVKMLETHEPKEIYNEILRKFTWGRIAKTTEELYRSIPKKESKMLANIMKHSGNRNFLCRLGIILEYLQIKIFDWIESKFK